MNIRDQMRLRQTQEIATSLQVNGMIDKTIAPKRLLVQIISLKHRSHRPIEQQNAL